MLGERHPARAGQDLRRVRRRARQVDPRGERAVWPASGGLFIEDLHLVRQSATLVEQGYFTSAQPHARRPRARGVGGVLIALSETTRRVRAEQALRASEERYQLALEAASGVGTWDWDIAADKVYADARYAVFHNVSRNGPSAACRSPRSPPLSSRRLTAACSPPAARPEDHRRVPRGVPAGPGRRRGEVGAGPRPGRSRRQRLGRPPSRRDGRHHRAQAHRVGPGGHRGRPAHRRRRRRPGPLGPQSATGERYLGQPLPRDLRPARP
jgi:PAS domain-containing protein